MLIKLNDVLKQLRAEAVLSEKILWLAKDSAGGFQAAFLMEVLDPGDPLIEEPIRCWDLTNGDMFKPLAEFKPWVRSTNSGNFQPDGEAPSRFGLVGSDSDPRLRRRA
jgi:hypothetical protein